MLNIKGEYLKNLIEGILKKIVNKYEKRADTFLLYLVNLQHTQNLTLFINNVYQNMGNLRLKQQDILQLLKELGNNSSIKEAFGYSYYLLWFQFFLIDQINIKERLSSSEIQQFSKSIEEQQIKLLQQICQAHGSSESEKQIQQKLEDLQEEQLFKQMVQVKRNIELKYLKESQLRYVKKSNLSNLNPKQESKVFLSILDKIFKKINVINKITNFQQKMNDLKELMNQMLYNLTYQKEILNCYLRSAILNLLGIQIKKHECIVLDQTTDVIKDRLEGFRKFFYFQKSLLQQQQIQNIFHQMKILLKDGMKDLWYWPTHNNKQSFIIFIIEKSSQADQMEKLIQILKCQTPNMTAPIFDINEREFLEQILTQAPKEARLGKLIKYLQKYAKYQNIDLEKQLKTGATYKALLQDRGVPLSHFQNWSQIVPVNSEDYFYIYCNKTRKRQRLYISIEDRDLLFDQWKDTRFYQSLRFSCKGYSLNYTLTDKMTIGSYNSNRYNPQFRYKSNVQYNGILNYGNLRKFQDLVKQFKWIILSEKWEEIIFDSKQNQQITQEVMRTIKNQDKLFKIKLRMGLSVQINIQTMIVNQLIISTESYVGSMMTKTYGYLVYLPAYKTKNISSDFSGLDDNEQDYSMLNPMSTQSQQARAEYQKPQSFDEKFQFLGVFKSFFQISSNFTIDQNQNVFASTPIASNYFKNWVEMELCFSMSSNLLENGQKSISDYKNYFKLRKKLYPQVKQSIIMYSQKMDKNIQFQYNQKEQNLVILNLKNKQQSWGFYQALIKYITLKVSKQCQKKPFCLEIEQQERVILQNQQNLKIVNFENSIVEITCTKQQKQKLLKEVAALDQTHQFTYQDPAAYKLMKQKDEEYLKSINLTENEVGQDFFKVSIKLKDHPAFKQRLLQYHLQIEKQGGDNIQQKMEKQAQFLHIYRSEFQKQSIQIDVSKIGNDLFVQYKQKMKKKVNRVLSKIQEEKQKQFFTIVKHKGRQYILKNVQREFIYKLKDKLIQTLKKTSQMPVNPMIDVKRINQNYILTALQISPEQQKIVDKEMQHFENRFKEFLQGKKQILNTSKILNDVLNRIPNNKIKSKIIESMRVDLKRYLRQSLNEIITQFTQKAIKNIQKQFQDFILNEKLDAVFTTKQKADCQKKILGEISKINIFEQYLVEFIKNKQNQFKKHINKEILQRQMAKIIKLINDKFKNNHKAQQQSDINDNIEKNISIKDLQSYFKSLNIFTVIYYGQQLPITQHLDKFKQLIQKNDVVLVKVGTGSGKSTVIPPYLVGLGYQKVVVTQPRRLPCSQIYKRVSDVFGEGICGYEVADAGEDRNNSLIYMTDGLLKMRAEYNFQELDKIDVLIIDEIHERSANIDILLLLLNEYYKVKNRKLKLVLCSATIDKSIGEILEDAHLRIATFEVSVQRYPITEHPIQTGNILNRILELAASLQSDQQMLVFCPSVNEVKERVNLLKNKHNHRAYPIMAQQNPIQQSLFLKVGQIFIATSIAETSLTFKNLRFVVDSRMSRCRKFNPVVELLQTQEDFSSNSSIAQRKGRLGRTCPGEYHYFVYSSYDFTTNRDHNRTELENNDLTSYIYELLLRKNASLRDVQLLMRKLNHSTSEFDQKFQYSVKILKDLNIIDSNNSLTKQAIKMMTYGNLGHPQHNYALYQASLNNCTIDMVYLVSFLMLGINRSSEILKDLKSQAKGGDLRTIHDFVANIAEKIDLNTINNRNQMKQKIKQNCSHISNKPWFSVIVRVMMKAKELLKICENKIPVSDWSVMVQTLLSSYKNKIFFNQAIFGGNKANYQKIREETFCFEQKEKMSDETLYKIDLNSLTYQKDAPPPIILSLNCGISPHNECVLSICEVLDLSKIRELLISVRIVFCQNQCQAKYFKDSQPMKEKELFNKLQYEIDNKYNNVKVTSKFPEMKLSGIAFSLSKAFTNFIEKQRRNGQLKIDLRAILEKAIAKRQMRAKKDYMLTVISKEYSMSLMQKLTNYDMKKMFQTMKFQMSNNYGVEIQWDARMSQTLFIVKNAKNLHLSIIIGKLFNFCRWFADSQTICKEQFKIKPQFIENTQFLARDVREQIMERVNQIVDSKIDHHIIKDWANCSGSSTSYLRTSRMIATCWILVNKFHCVIKGGFVRDWIVNNEEILPSTNRRNLLQSNPRNTFIEVVDESVTPSDIDAELSDFTLLDKEKFIKQMKKIGIAATIEEDGWRKHVIFDQGVQTGGFTADLIEPYTTLCHDTYDFDVNILYIKKDHLSSIGQKIPLQYQDKYGKKIKVSLEQLLSQCRKKEMCTLKESMPSYRLDKFKARGWKINTNEVHQPLIYKDYLTKSCPINPASIQSICPEFYQKMVVQLKCKVIRIESLVSKAWDDAFESIQHWIITEIAKNKEIKNVNSNNKMLFYGSKNQKETTNIKQFGFDSRFFSQWGFYGRGAHFLDDPKQSDKQTSVNTKNICKEMFVVLAALGTQQKFSLSTPQKNMPSKGYHSLIGRDRGRAQYIIERWGQAKPLYLISYKF